MWLELDQKRFVNAKTRNWLGRRKTRKDWDPQPASFPIGLYSNAGGMNRRERRAFRQHKNDPMPPSSNVPAVKRFDDEGKKTYVAAW